MADPAAPLYALLKQLSISHTETKHPAVFTVDAMMPSAQRGACLVRTPDDAARGADIKNCTRAFAVRLLER